MTGPNPRFPCPTCHRVVPGKRDRTVRAVVYLLRRHRLLAVEDDDTLVDRGRWCPGSELPPDHEPITLDRSPACPTT